MIPISVVLGAGLAGGVCLIVSGFWPSPHPTAAAAVGSGRDGDLRSEWWAKVPVRRLGLAAGAGLLVLVVLRWPAMAIVAAAAGWWAPQPGQRAARARAEARLEAIAQWCEMLRDATTTARGVEGILIATADTAPEPIRPEAQHLATRLATEPLNAALGGLAEDLDHPLGDLVVTALQVAATAGAGRLPEILDNLAATAHQEVRMRARVEVARARPKASLRLVAGIVGVFVAGLFIFAQDFMSPYRTVLGQIVLLTIGGYWLFTFGWMARLGRVAEPGRFLAPHPTRHSTGGTAR